MQELKKLKDTLELAKKQISAVLVDETMKKIKETQINNANDILKAIQEEVDKAKRELQSTRAEIAKALNEKEVELRERESSVRNFTDGLKSEAVRLKSEAQDLLAKAQKMASDNEKKERILSEKLHALKAIAG